MPHDDELEAGLRAFGQTLERETGEAVRPSTTVIDRASPTVGRSRWWLLSAAAACVALLVGSVFVLGRDDTAVAPVTLPAVDSSRSPTTPSPTTAAPPTVPTAVEPDPGVGLRPWEPMVYSGTGSQTVEIADDPVISRLVGAIDLQHDGTGPFRVTMVLGGVTDQRFDSVILDTVGVYDGRRGWRLADEESFGALRSIDVVADGDWTLELFSLVQSDEFTRLELTDGGTVSGSGDDVIQPIYLPEQPAGGVLVADFECSGCAGEIDVFTIGNQVQVLADAVGDGGVYTNTEVLPTGGWVLLIVQTATPGAPGDWTITLRPR